MLLYYLILYSTGRLELSENKLTGTLPSEIGLLADVGEFSWPSLAPLLLVLLGFFKAPAIQRAHACLDCIWVLNSTDFLTLWSNSLMGTIPSEIGLLTRLGEFCCFLLSTCLMHLFASLAICMCTLMLVLHLNSRSAEGLGLYVNKLTGSLPSEFGLLTLLSEFCVIAAYYLTFLL